MTVLRLACRFEEPLRDTPRFLGVDDWAYKKGQTYGTILVDLEKRQPIELLPDRESESLKKWLVEHPGVEIITRDRGGDYAKGASEGAPDAQQVADRWHLLKNLGDAVRRMLDGYNKELRQAAKMVIHQEEHVSINQLEKAGIAPEGISSNVLLSKYELNFLEVKRLQVAGTHSIRSICRQVGIHRETVKRYLKYDTYPDRHKTRSSQSVAAYGDHILKRWADGTCNRVLIFNEIREMGYTGSIYSLYRYTLHLKDPQHSIGSTKTHEARISIWSSRKMAKLLSQTDDTWSDEEKAYIENFFQLCPTGPKVQKLILDFKNIVNSRRGELFDAWIGEALNCGVDKLKRFAQGLLQDYSAVKAALTLDWSNGQVEGQVNRLKTVKRQMYGRAGFKLLRKRILFRSG